MLEEWDFQNIKIQSFIVRIDPVAYWGPNVYGYRPPLDKKGMNVPIWAKKWLIFMNVSCTGISWFKKEELIRKILCLVFVF